MDGHPDSFLSTWGVLAWDHLSGGVSKLIVFLLSLLLTSKLSFINCNMVLGHDEKLAKSAGFCEDPGHRDHGQTILCV